MHTTASVLSRPPMGWNSYDYYDTTVNEAQVLANAAYLAEHLKPFGWEYIVVDIQWYAHEAGQQRDRFQYVPFGRLEMDGYARLLPCPERFPSSRGGQGFRPLAEKLHAMGLKFGIHIMRGIPRAAAYLRLPIKGSDRTANQIANPYSICQWNPDMYGVNPAAEGAQAYYDSLLELYTDWGVDYIKCDDICRMDAASSRAEIKLLHQAIARCGRRVVLSLSPGPALPAEAAFYRENANLWRITDDFWDAWPLLLEMFDRCRTWQGETRDGAYPDCDMLPLGWLGKGFGAERETRLTRPEQRTMLTLWCIFRSPLMLGAELTRLDGWTLALLTNHRVLRLLDCSCNAREVSRSGEEIVWRAEEKDGSGCFWAIFNLSARERKVSAAPYLESGRGEELWSGTVLTPADTLCLSPHGAALVREALGAGQTESAK